MQFIISVRVEQEAVGHVLAAMQRDPNIQIIDLEINPVTDVQPVQVEQARPAPLTTSEDIRTLNRQSLIRRWISENKGMVFQVSDVRDMVLAAGRRLDNWHIMRQINGLIAKGVITETRKGWYTVRASDAKPLTAKEHILRVLEHDGPSPWGTLSRKLKDFSIPGSTIGSSLHAMKKAGQVHRREDGAWALGRNPAETTGTVVIDAPATEAPDKEE